jgi:hypothetical protein
LFLQVKRMDEASAFPLQHIETGDANNYGESHHIERHGRSLALEAIWSQEGTG